MQRALRIFILFKKLLYSFRSGVNKTTHILQAKKKGPESPSLVMKL
jgi:hypothetical protein